MKTYQFIEVMFLAALGLFAVGLAQDPIVARASAQGIILLTVIAFLATWVRPRALWKKGALLAFATASAYAFWTLVACLAVAFALDAFAGPLPNLVFAIFGSAFICIILARMQMAFALDKGKRRR